jgi:hypothetical protein
MGSVLVEEICIGVWGLAPCAAGVWNDDASELPTPYTVVSVTSI